jgi:hypothetical protein
MQRDCIFKDNAGSAIFGRAGKCGENYLPALDTWACCSRATPISLMKSRPRPNNHHDCIGIIGTGRHREATPDGGTRANSPKPQRYAFQAGISDEFADTIKATRWRTRPSSETSAIEICGEFTHRLHSGVFEREMAGAHVLGGH